MIPNLKRRFAEGGEWAKDEISAVMSDVACPVCHGKRLKPEVLAVTVGGKNIIELTELSVTKALAFFDELELSEREQFIAARIVKEIKERLGFLNNVGLEYLTLSRNAGTLSGGESQKVAIARSFYKKCPYVILDEPSANLDPVAEYNLNQAMLDAAKDKTVIFISHRLSTTVDADKIYVMENGEIIESGSHDELMKLNKTYAYMFNLQAEKYKN